MAVKVYAWPPVSCVGFEWTVYQPVSESYGLNGTRYISQSQPERRVAALSVPGIGRSKANAGYVEVLKRLLQGGVNLVRLQSMPSVWWQGPAALNGLRGQETLEWTADDRDLDWNANGGTMIWGTGVPLEGQPFTDGDFAGLRVTGLPASQVVAYPSELIRVTSDAGDIQTARVMAVAHSDATGSADIRLMTPVTVRGAVIIGARETAAFRIVGDLPRSVQPVAGNWSADFNFVEVREDEVTGGFEEINPWR